MLEVLIVRIFAVFGLTISGVNLDVAVSQPVIEQRGDSVAVTAVLLEPISEDLMNIIDSGTPVSLVFTTRLRYASGKPTGAVDQSVVHTVSRDLATGVYVIEKGRRVTRSSILSETSVFFRMETVPVWHMDYVHTYADYIVDVSAKLEPIEVRATGERYDLMALWNYREPSNRSEVFDRRMLERRRVTP